MIQTKQLDKVVYLISFMMFFIFPTSIGRTVFPISIIMGLWLFQCIIIAAFLINGKIVLEQLVISLFLVIYLLIATVVANEHQGLYFSLARMVPAICVLLAFCGKKEEKLSLEFFIPILEVACVVIIIWNLLTLAGIQPFINLVNSFYTQLDSYTATFASLLFKKPVFTFGVHNFAAIFYMHLFIMCYALFRKTKEKHYYIYMLAFIAFTLLLRSSASAGLALIMIMMMCVGLIRQKGKMILLIFVFLIGFGTLSQTSIFAEYVRMLTSRANGFMGRYFDDGNLYGANLKVLEEYPMGIGFLNSNSSADIYFADSGYMIYYTMGSLIFAIGIFYLCYRFLQNNFNKKVVIILFGITLLSELAMVGFFYNKMIYLYIFEVGFFGSLYQKDGEEFKWIE